MLLLESVERALEDRQVCPGESKMSHCPWLKTGLHILGVRPPDFPENNCCGSSGLARVDTSFKPMNVPGMQLRH